jgi:hypothetical protein
VWAYVSPPPLLTNTTDLSVGLWGASGRKQQRIDNGFGELDMLFSHVTLGFDLIVHPQQSAVV